MLKRKNADNIIKLQVCESLVGDDNDLAADSVPSPGTLLAKYLFFLERSLREVFMEAFALRRRQHFPTHHKLP